MDSRLKKFENDIFRKPDENNPIDSLILKVIHGKLYEIDKNFNEEKWQEILKYIRFVRAYKHKKEYDDIKNIYLVTTGQEGFNIIFYYEFLFVMLQYSSYIRDVSFFIKNKEIFFPNGDLSKKNESEKYTTIKFLKYSSKEFDYLSLGKDVTKYNWNEKFDRNGGNDANNQIFVIRICLHMLYFQISTLLEKGLEVPRELLDEFIFFLKLSWDGDLKKSLGYHNSSALENVIGKLSLAYDEREYYKILMELPGKFSHINARNSFFEAVLRVLYRMRNYLSNLFGTWKPIKDMEQISKVIFEERLRYCVEFSNISSTHEKISKFSKLGIDPNSFENRLLRTLMFAHNKTKQEVIRFSELQTDVTGLKPFMSALVAAEKEKKTSETM